MTATDDFQQDYIIGNGLLSLIAVILSFILVFMLISVPDSDLEYKLLTLFLGVITLLTWAYRINRKYFYWYPRAMIAVAFAALNFAIIDIWLDSMQPVSDSIDECNRCPGSRTIFGPLLSFLILGSLSLCYVIWGEYFTYSAYRLNMENSGGTDRFLEIKRIIWWCLYLPGMFLSIWILINNFNIQGVVEAGKGIGTVILVFAGIIVVIIGIVFLSSIPDRTRRKKVKEEFLALSPADKEEILSIYKEFVGSAETYNAYLPSEDNTGLNQCASKIGGIPYAETGDTWPELEEDDGPSLFCMQLMLKAGNIPEVWRGRLIVVYCIAWEIVVRSYSSVSLDKFVDISKGRKLMQEKNIRCIEVPFAAPPGEDDDEEAWEKYIPGYTADYALEECVLLGNRLKSITQYPAILLEYILDDAGYPVLSEYDSIFEGGAPDYIQNPHDPVCDICNQPMRYLFEFGEILEEEFTFGDAGMVYIYGCDNHPEHCQGFVDSH